MSHHEQPEPDDIARDDDGKPATIECPTHGKRRWNRTVMCSSCKRVFQGENKWKPLYAPTVCPCGARLAPYGEDEIAEHEAKYPVPAAPPGLPMTGGMQLTQPVTARPTSPPFTGRAICTKCFDRCVKHYRGRWPE